MMASGAITTVVLHILVVAAVVPWGVSGLGIFNFWYVILVVGGFHVLSMLAGRESRQNLVRCLKWPPLLALYGYFAVNTVLVHCPTEELLPGYKREFLANLVAMLVIGTSLIAGARFHPSPRRALAGLAITTIAALVATIAMQGVAISLVLDGYFLTTVSQHVYDLYDGYRGIIFLFVAAAMLGWLTSIGAWTAAVAIVVLYGVQAGLNASLAVQVAFAVAVLMAAVFWYLPRVATWLVIVGVLANLVGFTLVFLFVDAEAGTRFLAGAPENFLHRLYIWVFAASVLGDGHLWAGHGIGCVYYLPVTSVGEAFAFAPPGMSHNALTAAIPHSLSLAISTQTGLIGVGLCAFAAVAIVRQFTATPWRKANLCLLSAMGAWFVFTLFGFGNLFALIAQVYLWFAAALFALVRAGLEEQRAGG